MDGSKLIPALAVVLLFPATIVAHAQETGSGSAPEVRFPTPDVEYPHNTNITMVVELPRAEDQACGLWTFEIEIQRPMQPTLEEGEFLPRRFTVATQWTPQAETIETGATTINESGCLGIKRIRLPGGSYSMRTSARHENGDAAGPTGWTPFTVRAAIAAERQEVSPTAPAPPQLPAGAKAALARPAPAAQAAPAPERKPALARPDRGDLVTAPQARTPQIVGKEQALATRLTDGQTTVRVRQPGEAGDWGTEATIHSHQEVTFLWSTNVTGVASAEWQVWSEDPRGKRLPVSAKLATGALEITGAMARFPIQFGVFVSELPPELPAEEKYWITVSTRDAGGDAVGPPPQPVTVAFRACSDDVECSEEYFCDPDRRTCEEVEAFCAQDWEVPGYKGTGYSKGDKGGFHIQWTDGRMENCSPYRCVVLANGSPYCLIACSSTADCDRGYQCSADGFCE